MGAESGIGGIDVELVISEDAAKRCMVSEIDRVGQGAATILQLVASEGFQFEWTNRLQSGRAGGIKRSLHLSLTCFEFRDQAGKRPQVECLQVTDDVPDALQEAAPSRLRRTAVGCLKHTVIHASPRLDRA